MGEKKKQNRISFWINWVIIGVIDTFVIIGVMELMETYGIYSNWMEWTIGLVVVYHVQLYLRYLNTGEVRP